MIERIMPFYDTARRRRLKDVPPSIAGYHVLRYGAVHRTLLPPNLTDIVLRTQINVSWSALEAADRWSDTDSWIHIPQLFLWFG